MYMLQSSLLAATL